MAGQVTAAAEGVAVNADEKTAELVRERRGVLVVAEEGVPVVAELAGAGPWHVPLVGDSGASVVWGASGVSQVYYPATLFGPSGPSVDVRRTAAAGAGALRGLVERAQAAPGVRCEVLEVIEAGRARVNVVLGGSFRALDRLGAELVPHYKRVMLAALKPREVVPLRRTGGAA